MNRWILGLLVVTLCAAPAAASTIGVHASTFSPDGTDESPGFGFDARFGSGPWDFEFRVTIYEELEVEGTSPRLILEATPVDFGFNYNFGSGDRVHPYVGGGGTFAVLDFGVDSTITNPQRTTDIDPEWGYYVQVGLDFDLNDSTAIYVQGVYRILEAEFEEDDLGLERDGPIDLTGGALHLGIAFTW